MQIVPKFIKAESDELDRYLSGPLFITIMVRCEECVNAQPFVHLNING
mgnify:CR=1 FL=1|jgi:hypothetical protein